LKSTITSKQLNSLKSGDHKAFEAIYHALHRRVYNYCLGFVREHKIAEEVTADVFIILWQKKEILDPSLPVESFLYKVARDKSINCLKKIATDQKLRTNYINDYIKNSERSGEALLIDKENLSLIDIAITKLPPQQQRIFRMRYLKEKSNQEIANELNISVNTVKAHLQKARRSLSDLN